MFPSQTKTKNSSEGKRGKDEGKTDCSCFRKAGDSPGIKFEPERNLFPFAFCSVSVKIF